MQTFRIILAAALIIAGSVWILQGLSVLPGSFMTGQMQWTIYGGVAVLVGVGLLVLARRRKNSPKS